MNRYLVDTNILIYALAGKNPWANLMKKWIKEKRIALSSIVVAEFLTGATDKETKVFKTLLDKFNSLPVDTTIARLAADYRKEFLKRGRKLPLFDCLIAATCKLYKATIVTFNTADYPMKDISLFPVPNSR